jgi:hypothetical protein
VRFRGPVMVPLCSSHSSTSLPCVCVYQLWFGSCGGVLSVSWLWVSLGEIRDVSRDGGGYGEPEEPKDVPANEKTSHPK